MKSSNDNTKNSPVIFDIPESSSKKVEPTPDHNPRVDINTFAVHGKSNE